MGLGTREQINRLDQSFWRGAREQLEGLADLLKRGRGRANIYGAQPSLAAYVLSFCQRWDGRPALLVAEDDIHARDFETLLRTFAPEAKIALLPSREAQLSVQAETAWTQEAWQLDMLADWLEGSLDLLICGARVLLQKWRPMSRETLDELPQLELGGRLEPQELEACLLRLGYRREARAQALGTFARRGDIVDFCPAWTWREDCKQHGLRVSFFDDEIDQLKIFDTETQRALDNCSTFRLRPLRPYSEQGQEEELAAKIEAQGGARLRELRRRAVDAKLLRHYEEQWILDCERLRQGLPLQAWERYFNLIYPEARSLVDYAQDLGARVYIYELSRLRRRLDGAQMDFHKRVSHYIEQGRLDASAIELQWQRQDVFLRLDQLPQLLCLADLKSASNGWTGAQDWHLRGREAEHFYGHDDKMDAQFRLLQAAGEEIWVFVETEERRAAFQRLQAEKGWRLSLLPGRLRRGFRYPSAAISVFGEEDVFGQQRQRRRRAKDKNSLRLNFFSDLKIGDKVVHEVNGIGIYQGIQNTEDADGHRRDYLSVAYAAGDMLYLPMDQLSQLQKYVGTDVDQVRLSRLGGGEWQRQKERARASIKKLVTDLVKLYAQREVQVGHAFSADSPWDRDFADRFPYEETQDQLRCIDEIFADMERPRVMDRLLCGDVGFGKTELAFRAMFKCVQDGKQAALLAPTTVLAQQHYANFVKRVEGFPVKVGQLSRFVSPAEQRRVARQLGAGMVDVVIGTHSLLSKSLQFKDLGLLVIDEEQRFGVDHKEQLKARYPGVDVLSMSATPIPRTLHMSMSGIRDISVLEEAPEERRPVETYVMEYDPLLIQEALRRELERGGQVFYLHNDTRSIDAKAAEIAGLLPGARVLSAHGKMSEQQLEQVIEAFLEGEGDILVCTTIIESGIDMPRVNTIVVERAERFGLAQLYQLRGRVGRSERQGYAYITYRPQQVLSEEASKRLSAIRDFTDLGSGFIIALRDLEIRGAGNLLGGEQHGQMNAIGYDLYSRMLAEEIRQAMEEQQSQQPQQSERTAELHAGNLGRQTWAQRAESPGLAAQSAGGRALQARMAELQAQAASGTCSFEIELDAYIPERYIPDDAERMELYRRISRICSQELYNDVMEELLDRYGDPPREVEILMDVAYSRAWAEKLGLGQIRAQQEACLLQFRPGPIREMELLSILLNLEDWRRRLNFRAGLEASLLLLECGSKAYTYPAQLRQLFWQLELAVKRLIKEEAHGKSS